MVFQKGHPQSNTGRTHFKKGVPNNVRENNPRWKGGKFRNKNGYAWLKQYKHPFRTTQDYVRRSRLVMEKYLGRYLKPEEVVHHKGIKYSLGSIKNKQDDRPKNLQLFANGGKHTSFHEQLKRLKKK